MPAERTSYISPSADTLTVQWATSTGGLAHYSLVDDNPITIPDDTDYVYTSVSGRQDIYSLPNWPTWNQSVPANPNIWIPSITIHCRAKSLNGAAATKLAIYHNLGGTPGGQTPTTSWADYTFDITSVASHPITVDNLDSMEIGITATIGRAGDTIYVSQMYVEIKHYYRMQPGFGKVIWTP